VTASLPPDVQAVFDRFITTELTTVDGAGQPITWPVTPYYHPGEPCIDVTTGLGYPKKANDAQANPLVSLLFSDPTGSGLEKPPVILVDDKDLDANRRRYSRDMLEKLPGLARWDPPDQLKQRFMGWYYTRIYIHVRPERIYVWRGDEEPELYDAHMEEVRSGHSEEPDRFHAAPEGGATAWHPRIRQLGANYRTAVLSFVSPDGFPFAMRVPVQADEHNRWVRIDAPPEGAPLQPGLACLTAHAHEPGLTWMENFQVRGDLVEREDHWTLLPHKIVGGIEAPPSRLEMLRTNAGKAVRFRRTAKREFARRQ